MEAALLMTDKKIRVISMPCMEIFEQQSFKYKNSLMPKRGCLRVTIEAGIISGWEKYAGYNGLSIGLDRYGIRSWSGIGNVNLASHQEN